MLKLFFFAVGCVRCAGAMLSKRGRSSSTKDQAVPGAKRLRGQVVDLFASNVIPGALAQEMTNAARDAGLNEFKDLANRRVEQRVEKHASRNLRRRLLKTRAWPSVYKALVPTWSQKSQQVVQTEMSFCLPHATLSTLLRFGGDRLDLFDTSQMDPVAFRHFTKMVQKLPQDLPWVAIGLWVDAVPCNWDRSESLEVPLLGAGLRLVGIVVFWPL